MRRIIVEDPAFPAWSSGPAPSRLKDEIYQMKELLAREHPRADAPGSLEARPVESHGAPQGPRFRRDLGQDVRQRPRLLLHPRPRGSNWDEPEMQKMYAEAIKWALRLVDADDPAATPALRPALLLRPRTLMTP